MMTPEIFRLQENLSVFVASYLSIMRKTPPPVDADEQQWRIFLNEAIYEYFKKQTMAPFSYVEQPKFNLPNLQSMTMEVGDTITGGEIYLPTNLTSMLLYSPAMNKSDVYSYNNSYNNIDKPGSYLYHNGTKMILLEVMQENSQFASSACVFRVTRIK